MKKGEKFKSLKRKGDKGQPTAESESASESESFSDCKWRDKQQEKERKREKKKSLVFREKSFHFGIIWWLVHMLWPFYNVIPMLKYFAIDYLCYSYVTSFGRWYLCLTLVYIFFVMIWVYLSIKITRITCTTFYFWCVFFKKN